MCATRRSFLGKAAATALVTATSGNIWAQSKRELTTNELIGRETMATATPQTWDQWVGGIFKLSLGATTRGTVQLTKVESMMYPPRKASQPADLAEGQLNGSPSTGPFGVQTAPGMVPEIQVAVLWFRRRGKPLSQETYTVEHDWLGTFDLLIAPSRVTLGSMYCFAVVSHLTGRMVAGS
jgi:hypothetical protein